MREDFDERVLHRFVGLGGVAQVLVRDARGAALVNGDEACEALSRFIDVASFDKAADLDREPRILGQRHRDSSASADVRDRWGGGASDGSPQISTHKALRSDREGVYSLP